MSAVYCSRKGSFEVHCDVCGSWIGADVSLSDVRSGRPHYCKVCLTKYESAQGIAVVEQDPPIENEGDVTFEVIKDLEDRRQLGIERYGTHLQPFNGRDSLVDAYQEMLDFVVYIKQYLIEQDR
jgi:hypothetical protein